MALPSTADLLTIFDDLKDLQSFKYVTIASLVVLVWDYILTFSGEAYLVWPSSWGVPKLLFLLNRYLPFIDCTLLVYAIFAGGSPEFCINSFRGLGWIVALGYIIAQVILMIRTWAIYERKWGITLLLLAMFLPCLGTDIYVVHKYLSGISPASSPIPGMHGCLYSFSTRIIFVDFALIIFLETITIVLLILKAVKHLRHTRSPIMVIMYRDGIFHYCFILISTIANLCMTLLAPIALHNSLIMIQRVLHSVLCSRILLHIRGAYTSVYGEAQVISSGSLSPSSYRFRSTGVTDTKSMHGTVRDSQASKTLAHFSSEVSFREEIDQMYNALDEEESNVSPISPIDTFRGAAADVELAYVSITREQWVTVD